MEFANVTFQERYLTGKYTGRRYWVRYEPWENRTFAVAIENACGGWETLRWSLKSKQDAELWAQHNDRMLACGRVAV